MTKNCEECGTRVAGMLISTSSNGNELYRFSCHWCTNEWTEVVPAPDVPVAHV